MTDLIRYVFSTVRIVPNPATGEFANLGIIAGSDLAGDWSLRQLANENRVLRFCGHHAVVAGHDFIARVGLMMTLDAWSDPAEGAHADGQISEAWLAETAARNRHVVQLSAPQPILAESADDALDLLFPRLFPQSESRRRTLDKRIVASDMQHELLSVGLDQKSDFERRVRLEAAGPKPFGHVLDFAVADDAARQLIQTWSFQIANQSDLVRDVKAWGWTMRELRDHGGSVLLRGHHVHVADDVPLEVVVAPPTDEATGEDQERYAEALSVFEEVGATVTQHGEQQVVAERAADLIGRLGG